MPIDLKSIKRRDQEEAKDLLKEIQGNILTGHGRPNTVNLFLRFKEGKAPELRKKLSELLPEVVTSAAKQRDDKDRKKQGDGSGIFGAFFLTASGYGGLGFTEKQLTEGFVEEPDPSSDFNPTFKEGMKASRAALEDPDPHGWDEPFRNSIDALILLAGEDADALQQKADWLKQQLAPFADEVGRVKGKARFNAQPEGIARPQEKPQGIEHFGFVDGRSQPVFFEEDLTIAKEGRTEHWNPQAQLDLVLTRDPMVPNNDYAFGSYYVFRKLEQNVLAFEKAVDTLTTALELPAGDRELAAAMFIGRFRDGTPLLQSPRPTGQAPPDNDFRFDGQQSDKCPFHAHIRKVNPRGDARPEVQAMERRIVRRGISYGERDPQAADRPEHGVGLLFACYQANIAKQFAFIQRAWANSALFAQAGTGPDPLVGVPLPNIKQQWPKAWGDATKKPLSLGLGGYVRMKGGEYFFAPSMAFFKKLKDG
jgi:Dyp-type peroxidase family